MIPAETADIVEEATRCRALWAACLELAIRDARLPNADGHAARAFLRRPDPGILTAAGLDPDGCAARLAALADAAEREAAARSAALHAPLRRPQRDRSPPAGPRGSGRDRILAAAAAGPLAQGDLADRARVGRGYTSIICRDLEAEGLALRERVAGADGAPVMVRLTEAGRAHLASATAGTAA